MKFVHLTNRIVNLELVTDVAVGMDKQSGLVEIAIFFVGTMNRSLRLRGEEAEKVLKALAPHAQ